ncbi:hypothetical protein NHQ30_002073 [Ciborinia camelliae]|nr:hypothetical protein NHQ30_002073 [Ciborinia camelliae]
MENTEISKGKEDAEKLSMGTQVAESVNLEAQPEREETDNAAEVKKNRDIAEQKRAEAVSLKRSGGQTPEFLETIGTQMVDLYVGPEKKLFRIHRGILCDKVPYFQKMFSSGFVEGLELKAFFPEDDVKAFDLFIGWVYFGTLRTVKHASNGGWFWDVIYLYALADKFCLPELMDLVFDDELANDFLFQGFFHIEEVYSLTPQGSPLRKFFCYSMYYIFAAPRHHESATLWPTKDLAMVMKSHEDFAIDFLNLMRTQPVGVAPTDPTKLPRCEFHHHGKDEPCSQTPKGNP